MWQKFVPAVLSISMICTSAAVAAPATDGESCKGTMELGGETYTLTHAVAYPVKVFDDEGYAVIFANQAIPVEKLRAALVEGKGNADKFFFFKPHVTVTFDKDGKPMFCNAYADNNSLSVSGPKLGGALVVKDGKASGKTSLTTEPDDKRKSSFEVSSFELSLLVLPAFKTEPAVEKKESDSADKPAVEKKAAVHYKDLPLPTGATEVQYQKLTGQIRCKAPGTVEKVAEGLTKQLADQGWETQGKDLVSKSAALQRKHGDATLTIFVRGADDATSTVQIMSTGLAWDEKK